MAKFKIIFQDKESQTLAVDYKLHSTILAEKWFTKIRHLSKIQIDPVESDVEDVNDLDSIYIEFCKFAGIQCDALPTIRNQKFYNRLHQLFEENHQRLSVESNNDIIYKFHHAIHKNEYKGRPKIYVGWGVKEGPLTQRMNCQPFYEDHIVKNNLYLPWSELGKTPHTYWTDGEPNDQYRFNNLCVPHVTFRAKFYVALENRKCSPFTNQFNQYFSQFKQKWLDYHGMDDWSERDEWCAPLLAYTDCAEDLQGMTFKKILL